MENAIITAWVADGEQPSAEFGFAVAAGDVNGDGFGDVLVGIPKYGDDIARAGAVFGYYGGPGGLKSTPDWQMTGTQAGARFGGAVAAGDVNGDGFDDVFVGAFRFNGGQAEEGAVFGFYGNANGPGNTPNWVTEGEIVDGQFGYAVADAGDVNGDGFGDMIIGARGQNAFGGAAFVYLGAENGLSTSHAWATANLQAGQAWGLRSHLQGMSMRMDLTKSLSGTFLRSFGGCGGCGSGVGV
ncbi:MAG: FG-GAP repeat protein [Anaerolineales bacterium]|nr:FG-GAP repeat protein [Anaerolineales bacterium]